MKNCRFDLVSQCRNVAVASALGLFAACGTAQTPKAAGLEGILAQMNAASAKFTNAQADLRQELYTKALHDSEVSFGQVYFLNHSGMQMGMRMSAPDAPEGSPAIKIIQFQGGVVQMLNTGTSQVDEFSAGGKNQSTAEAIMALGFGGSGTDLKKEWTITDMGTDTVDGAKADRLDLIPKDPNIRKTYSHITIWLDPVRDVSLKQVSYDASSGDTRTVIYSNIRLNQKVDAGPFQIKCKGKCTVVKH